VAGPFLPLAETAARSGSPHSVWPGLHCASSS